MEFKFVQIKGQILFKGEIITKMQTWGEVTSFTFLTSSPEPLGQF
jgi:hypothetical protein